MNRPAHSCMRQPNIKPAFAKARTGALLHSGRTPSCRHFIHRSSPKQPPRTIQRAEVEEHLSSNLGGEKIDPYETSAKDVLMTIRDLERDTGVYDFNRDELSANLSSIAHDVEDLAVQAEKGRIAGAVLQNAQQELKESKEKYLRLNADFDNYRKRSGAEKEQLGSKIRGEIIKSLVPLVDSFEAAQNSVKAETENEKAITSSYQGLYKQMVETFKNLGVEAVPGVGEPFDPNFHDAIMREPSSEYPDGTVLQEFRKGFRLGDTLLRPGMVKVSFIEDAATGAESNSEGGEKIEIPVEIEAKEQ